MIYDVMMHLTRLTNRFQTHSEEHFMFKYVVQIPNKYPGPARPWPVPVQIFKFQKKKKKNTWLGWHGLRRGWPEP